MTDTHSDPFAGLPEEDWSGAGNAKAKEKQTTPCPACAGDGIKWKYYRDGSRYERKCPVCKGSGKFTMTVNEWEAKRSDVLVDIMHVLKKHNIGVGEVLHGQV